MASPVNSGSKNPASNTPPRRMTRPERRYQLLATAAELIAEKGVSGLTMEGLAREVGVTKPIVYDHFANVTGILVALLEQAFEQLEGDIDAIMNSDEPLEARIRASTHLSLSVLSENPSLLTLITGPLGDPELDKKRQELRDQRSQKWTRWYRRELGLDRQTADVITAMLQAAMEGAARQVLRGRAPRSLIERLAADLVATGLKMAAGQIEVWP
jgi:AcrR family transcriptional regulator